jgi:DNA-binding beta-propeller fold protein YncE
MPMTRLLILTLLGLPWLLAGCSDSAIVGRGGYADDDDDWADEDPGFADDDDDGAPDAGDDDGEPPPEEEDEVFTSEPRGTDVFVFVANPDRDTVSKIHAVDRTIETIDVGDEPIQVLVSPDYQRAVTFNAGGDSVSVINVGTDAVHELDVREDFNFIQMSPDGRWVVAYFNAKVEEAEFDVDGVRSFTEVSFVDTWNLQVQSYSVGFNPKEVQFSADSRRAVVVSDSFLTVAELAEEPIGLSLVDLGADPVDPLVAAEVKVTPAGTFAFVRYVGVDTIQVVELDTGDLDTLDGGIDPSDLDLSPDGTEAIVVSRGSQELRIFDAIAPFGSTPTVIPTPSSSTLGTLNLAPGGASGLLFTTAVLEDRITFWDRASGELTERGLAKPVDAVAISPDGASALIVHTLADVEDSADVFTDREAITVVDLDTWLTNPVALEDKPTRWTSSNDGRYALFIMENNRNVGVIDYQTRLVDDLLVPSLPVHIGTMPPESGEDALGWVSQQHELGRISFIRPFEQAVETVTGFELNSDID